jgi:hypothetical protein
MHICQPEQKDATILALPACSKPTPVQEQLVYVRLHALQLSGSLVAAP